MNNQIKISGGLQNMNKKLLVTLGILGLFVSLVSAVAIYYHSIDVTAHVPEPLSSTTFSLDFSGFPAETIVKTFDVNNLASVGECSALTWTETENLNGVTYTTDMPKDVTLASGDNTVSVQLQYAGDSAIGDVKGTVTLNRIAC